MVLKGFRIKGIFHESVIPLFGFVVLFRSGYQPQSPKGTTLAGPGSFHIPP